MRKCILPQKATWRWRSCIPSTNSHKYIKSKLFDKCSVKLFSTNRWASAQSLYNDNEPYRRKWLHKRTHGYKTSALYLSSIQLRFTSLHLDRTRAGVNDFNHSAVSQKQTQLRKGPLWTWFLYNSSEGTPYSLCAVTAEARDLIGDRFSSGMKWLPPWIYT